MPSDTFQALHVPVLMDEVRRELAVENDMVVVDATLGDGGHSALLCEHVGAGGLVIGIDRDTEAVALAQERLVPYGNRFRAIHGNYADLPELVSAITDRRVDRVLLDLGWSTTQFLTRHRGFSFMTNEPLDMRYDTSEHTPTAAELINTLSESDLAGLFRRLGEEPRAVEIAHALVEARYKNPIATTQQLAHLVMSVAPRTGKTHPATQVFQALRIAVNHELDLLLVALPRITDWLTSGARVAIITFHSLEDRFVKQYIAQRSDVRALTKKPLVPTHDERKLNPRARSSKLRVFEKI